ncbi:MAG: hypothetical protein U0271_16440 [Polyangiaceae bacterium]
MPAAKKPAAKKPASKKPAAKKPASKRARAVSAVVGGREVSVAQAQRILTLQFEPRSDTIRLERVGARSHSLDSRSLAQQGTRCPRFARPTSSGS